MGYPTNLNFEKLKISVSVINNFRIEGGEWNKTILSIDNFPCKALIFCFDFIYRFHVLKEGVFLTL